MKKKIYLVTTKIIVIAVSIVLLTALFLNLSTLWSVGKVKRGGDVTSGYYCAIIGSGSMEPTVLVNDLLLIQGQHSYQAEDIITYISPKGSLVTHRVVAVTQNGYIAQGDANNMPDDEIAAQRVLGKVVFVVPKVGSIINGIVSPMGIALLVCIYASVTLIRRIGRDENEDTHAESSESAKTTSQS